MKKTKVRVLGAALLLLALVAFALAGIIAQNGVAHADGLLDGATSLFEDLFSDKEIESMGYLYNYDGSADYIYIDFEGSTGYAIFAEETLEILEYSMSGNFPFAAVANDKKFYGGPRAYFTKSDDVFVNTITNERIAVSSMDVSSVAQSTRASLEISAKPVAVSDAMSQVPNSKVQGILSHQVTSNTSRNSTRGPSNSEPSNSTPSNPPLDEANWISPTAGATYITNAAYFLTAGQSPTHGRNNGTSCTAVATTLMMSYNNFYNDRRIIAPHHLNGGWNNSTGNGNIHDQLNYTNRDQNPNVSVNPMSMTSQTMGTNQAYHDLFVTNNITGHLHDAVGNLRTHLNGRLGTGNFVLSQDSERTWLGLGNWKTIASTHILSEINAGRPIIIATGSNINGTSSRPNENDWFDHTVVAYGHQTFAAYSGSGNNTSYLGYIVHMGWTPNGGTGTTTNIWTNSAWYYGYISFRTNHVHNYNNYIGGIHQEVRCNGCGHRELAYTTNIKGNTNSATTLTVTGIRSGINVTGTAEIPANINGRTVTEIGTSAFANSTMSQITIPANVTRIGVEAFRPSTVLTYFGGNRSNIDFVIAEGTKQTYINNGWSGFNFVELSGSGALTVVSGQINGALVIPQVFNNRIVAAIGNNAFANQTQLSQISIPSSVTSIGDSAFINCTNLQNVSLVSEGNLTDVPDHITSYTDYYYTERSLNVNLVAGSTYTLSFDFQLYNISTSHTNIYTSLGVGNTTFAVDLPVQKAFANTYGRQVVTFTPTAAQLATSSKLWCRFIRTSTPQSVAIEISNVRLDKGVADIAINSFSGCTKLATPGLSYRLNNNTYAVSKGTANTTTLFIPSTYNGKPVTQIDASGFKSTNFRWVFLQAGLTTIGNRAFQFCPNLETVEMSATSVTSIEPYTFDVCLPNTTKNGFKDIKLPDGLLTVGEGAFIRTHNNMELPSTVTNIGSYAFAQSKRVAFGLPDSLIEIGAYAFANSAAMIALVYTGSSLAIIGDHAFDGTLLPTVGRLYASVVTVGAYAFYNSMFLTTYHIEEGSQLTKIGDYAFGNDNIERIILHSSITHIGIGAFNGNEGLTIYAEQASRPSTWNVNWNNSNRPVVWGCTLSSDKTYVNSFVKSASNPSNAANGVGRPTRSGYSFGGWYTTSDFSGTQYMDLTTAPNGRLYAKWTQSSSCVAEGTLITLADGSQVAVEDLTGEEMLLVWNMLTGTFDVAPILFIDSDPYGKFEVIHLYFSDGTEVEVISEHGFWDIDLNQYVFLRSDAAQYIGHWFNKQTSDGNGNMTWTAVQLVDVAIYNQNTTAWSPVTFGHLCYYVNGMLSMPGATEGLINIFEVNAATMQYDADSFAADISTYGLYTYEEFAQIIPIPEAVFEAFNGQYLKVSIGKGLIDMDGIAALIERYADFFQ